MTRLEMIDLEREIHAHNMAFANLIFHNGVNITVRHGAKWANRAKLRDQIWVVSPDHTAEMPPQDAWHSEICGIMYCDFDEIPASLHKLNHDPACQTKAGIKSELTKLYGPFKPFPDVIGYVTVIFFTDPRPSFT